MVLGYCPDHACSELELWSTTDSVFWTAAERAAEKISRPIRVRQAMAGEPRYPFEDRLWPLKIEGLRHLEVLIPEAHDQVLLKAARAEPLDLVTEIHRANPLSLGTLGERYHEMERHVAGPRSRFRDNYLALVAKLFGEGRKNEVEKRLNGKK